MGREAMLMNLSEPFHLDHTLDSGQVFRWRKVEDHWEGVVNGTLISLTQENSTLKCNCDEAFISSYFRFDDNLDSILDSIDKDEKMHHIITSLRGLRIIRQDPWECLISFICSAFNNIPRIKKIIEHLCMTYGKPLAHGFAFPSPRSLATASLKDLRECGVGYRDAYILKTARIIDAGFSLHSLKSLSYVQAKAALMKLPGVGHKVAECVLLFSLDKLEAFPCDVNIQKCISRLYPACSDITLLQHYFGPYAGYANHYLYHFQRLWKNQ
jgi:N-glycosylase/DNA lyase